MIKGLLCALALEGFSAMVVIGLCRIIMLLINSFLY